MFSTEEKKKIADATEKLLLSFNHPEMPKEKVTFMLHIDGKESWSWADIKPNWQVTDTSDANQWNEKAREVLPKMNEIEKEVIRIIYDWDGSILRADLFYNDGTTSSDKYTTDDLLRLLKSNYPNATIQRVD